MPQCLNHLGWMFKRMLSCVAVVAVLLLVGHHIADGASAGHQSSSCELCILSHSAVPSISPGMHIPEALPVALFNSFLQKTSFILSCELTFEALSRAPPGVTLL